MKEQMPCGSVLVVDDSETNLYVAKRFIQPYGLEVKTVLSGYEAIELIEGGEAFAVIFMDHMMPQMDGIEATEKIRAIGYTGAVVALTANFDAGQTEMFLSHGFDGFLSKPIVAEELDEVLNRFIRNGLSEEALLNAPTFAVSPSPANDAAAGFVDSTILAIFCNDAKNAVVTLQKTAQSGDLELFAITAHAMKSNLATVGEKAMSEKAAQLEKAGKAGDADYIEQNAEFFCEDLQNLAERIGRKLAADAPKVAADYVEDSAFLNESLTKLAIACDNYDMDTIDLLLAALNDRQWTDSTSEFIRAVSENILVSDYDIAVAAINAKLTV
jgi:CheY-like chemotaxis protein